ncbi:MAG: thioredoxin, partial [Actinomycetota bacterium]
MPFAFDAMLVIGPEHARVFAEAKWGRERLLTEINDRLQLPGSEIVRGAGGMAEGVQEAFKDAVLPKFRPGGL